MTGHLLNQSNWGTFSVSSMSPSKIKMTPAVNEEVSRHESGHATSLPTDDITPS